VLRSNWGCLVSTRKRERKFTAQNVRLRPINRRLGAEAFDELESGDCHHARNLRQFEPYRIKSAVSRKRNARCCSRARVLAGFEAAFCCGRAIWVSNFDQTPTAKERMRILGRGTGERPCR
jgi:hypothetical protein